MGPVIRRRTVVDTEARHHRIGLTFVLGAWVAILASAAYIAGQLIRWLAQP